MNTKLQSVSPETQQGYWGRVLRPLIWWAILVFALFAVHQHQLALERTRIYFSYALEETNMLADAVVALDGQPVGNGDNIALGFHRFTITQPKAQVLSTNFFAWYGRHDFGKLNLKRAMGTLSIKVEPAAKEIVIDGPEIFLTLHDSTGTNVLVPTDTYRVIAQYSRISERRDVSVTASNTAACTFAPQLGAISVTCNETQASYELVDGKGNFVERGDVPVTISGIPQGAYSIVVVHHQWQMRQETSVTANKTTVVPFHFNFGAVRFESTPPGANVYTKNGTVLGTTPMTVTELPTSSSEFRLQLNGYQETNVSVRVAENTTNTASVTLVSLNYVGSMQAARQNLNAGNYREAANAVEQALAAKPGDADALELQKRAKGRQQVQDAKELANKGDFLGAGKKLQVALTTLPEDAEAKSLVGEYKSHEAEQIGKMEQQKTRELFDTMCKAHPVANLFEEHEVQLGAKSPEEVRNAVVQSCETELPKWKVTRNQSDDAGLYELTLLQASDNPLITARRECLVVIGKGKDNKTVALFKVLEFQRRARGLADLALNVNNPSEWIPVHPSRMQLRPLLEEQIREGVKMMTKMLNLDSGTTK